MTERQETTQQVKAAAGADREARLKAALKANISRRKAQARARASQSGDAKQDDQ